MMIEATQKPAARTIQAPAHLVDPTGAIAAWWTEPTGALVQLREGVRGTTELAEWLVGPALEAFLARFPGDARDLTVVLDMRAMRGRSAKARSVLMQASAAARGRIRRVVLLPSVHMGPAYLSIIEATAVMLRLAGYEMHVESELDAVLSKHAIRIESISGVQRAVRS